MLIKPAQRREKLVSAGVSKAFLDAVDTPADYEQLEFLLEAPEGAYFYLPSLEDSYSILQGYDITPVCDVGESFYVLLSNTNEQRFVYFELEQDEIYKDFGASFHLMLAHLLVDYYDFAIEEIPVTTLSDYGDRLGFARSNELFKKLVEADTSEARSDFEKDAEWRKKILPILVPRSIV